MIAIRKHFKDFIAVVGLILVAGGVSAYILSNQRMRFPLIEEKPYVLKAEFQTAQAVIAGPGQTVRVAGVRIGDIGAVELKDGRAIVRMDIDRKYEDMVHTDATALLRPKTGLKDMFIQLDPGTDGAPVAKENWTIPVDSTSPDVNPDEILSTLDSDTRDYLRLLISDLGRGLKGRNGDLRDLFRRFEPTHRDLAAVNGAIAERRTNLRRLITSLNQLNGELASHDDDIAGLVTASSAVLRSFASEESNISAAVRELPSTLQQTTASLGQVQQFAEVLGPTVQRLRPASVQLADAAPGLTRTFKQLNNFFNLLAYNPNGREGPENAARQEGYLFWLGWAQHMAIQLFSSSDANGVVRPVTIAAPCATIEQTIKDQPEIEFLQMLTPLLTESKACATK